jgi:hypothetical protein
MSTWKTEVYLTKIAAAQRQIDAAARMFLFHEDELAIHTVAAAAYRIVRDIRKKRGRLEIPHEPEIVGIFYMAKAYAEGRSDNLPKALKAVADSDPQIQKLATLIRRARERTGRDADLADFKLSTFGIDEHRYWNRLGEPANFLKHADRDQDDSIPLSKIKSDDLLVKAICSFFILTKCATPEMRVFMLYRWSQYGDSSGLSEAESTTVRRLAGLKPALRRKAALKLLSAMKK